MVPFHGEDFIADLNASMAAEAVTRERLDESVLRVLELKTRLGLLADHVPGAPRAAPPSTLSPLPVKLRAQQAADSLRAAAQSIVLVKNQGGALPLNLAQRIGVVAVVGPSAKSRKNLLGGWTTHWQGPVDDAEVSHVLTVTEALRRFANATVTAAVGVNVDGSPAADDAVAAAEAATVGVVFVYGEGTYAEIGGDALTGYLPQAQLELARRLRDVCVRRRVPLVGVYLGGRDRLLTEIDALLDAHLIAFYPGPYGGEALAYILSGRVSPSARLPITLHRDDSQNMPYWQSHLDYERFVKSRANITALYPFGHGLAYVPFTFSNMTVTVLRADSSAAPRLIGAPAVSDEVAAEFGPGDRIRVGVTVGNRGAQRASTPVLLFVADEFRILPPEVRLLKGASRVRLAGGARSTVAFELVMDDFAFDTNDDVMDLPGRVVQPGNFKLTIETESLRIRFVGDPSVEADWLRLSTHVRTD